MTDNAKNERAINSQTVSVEAMNAFIKIFPIYEGQALLLGKALDAAFAAQRSGPAERAPVVWRYKNKFAAARNRAVWNYIEHAPDESYAVQIQPLYATSDDGR